MGVLSLAALRKQLASGTLDPLYVLAGDDATEKSAVATEFADTVEEGLRAFNVERFYGGDTRVDDFLDAANTLPMMAARRLVIVLEAEKLLVPKRESKAADADQERLEAFVAAPPSHATVVFVCGALDLRRRVVKRLLAEAQVVNCGTIETEADADLWIKARAARDKVNIDPAAVRTLVSRAGFDIVRLRAGLERAALYALGQPMITADDVRQAVPAAPEVQQDFGIAKAISRGDAREALKELRVALEAGAIPVMVMGQLRVGAERLPAARVNAGVDALFRTDLALKSSAGDPRILLERLVVELCGRRDAQTRTPQGPRYGR